MGSRTSRARRGGLALGAALFLAGCVAPGGGASPAGTPPGISEEALLVPPGFGSLLQEEITVTLRSDDLQIKVTPLEEWVLRLAAPDSWERLSSLAASHLDEVRRRSAVDDPTLFLVSFFSREPSVTFHPEDVQLVNRGRRHRALVIRPVTAGWGTQRLDQEETQLAVYAFAGGVDLEQDLTIEYGSVVSTDWEAILRRLEVERGRARARAGIGPLQD